MAQKTVTHLVDDLDGTPIGEGEGETVTFSVQGTDYEIDLNRKNADELHEVLAPYISAARKVSGRGGRGRSSQSEGAPRRSRGGSGDYEPKAVRAWAQANGIDVPARGRIPQKVIDQYREAN